MSSPAFHFNNKEELLAWFQENIPEAHLEYLETKKKIKDSNFSGNLSLLKRESNDNTLENFLTTLTEFNIANLLLDKGKTDIKYEPKGFVGIDFSFDKILLSVKSLITKNYEKVENDEIERLKNAGGGKNTLQHKQFSDTHIEVEKNSMGTYTYSRLETGHSGFLDSDMSQMSPPLKYIGEFENQSNTDGFKKVIFILSYSSEFRPYHGLDIGLWYFDALPEGYYRIFNNDPAMYFKLFGKDKKENTIDAIVFMFPPRPHIWPKDCFNEVINDQPRVRILTRDDELFKDLKKVFS